MQVQRWSLGEIEIVRVVDFQLALPAPAGTVVPAWMSEQGFADPDTGPLLASSAIGIAVGRREGERLVVDPWLAFDGDRSDPGAVAPHADRLLGALAEAGFAPHTVDVVVNSHVDGIGWNVRPSDDGQGWVAAFPNARYRFSQAELDLWPGDDRLAPLLEAGAVDAFDPPAELAPGVTAESAPGHGDGHCVVRVRSDGAEALIGGHLFISPLSVSDPTVGLDGDDAALAADVRRGLLADAAERHLLLIAPLLGGPGGGYVEADGDGSWRLCIEPK